MDLGGEPHIETTCDFLATLPEQRSLDVDQKEIVLMRECKCNN